MNRCTHRTSCGRVCKNKKCNGLDTCNIHTGQCYICLEKNTKDHVTTLVCGHVYHTSCISNWFPENITCPTCRKVAHKTQVSVTCDHGVDYSLVDAVVRNLYNSGKLTSTHLRAAFCADQRTMLIDVANNTIIHVT